MKSTPIFKMELFSDQALTPESALEQIEALASFANGLFRPEKCDLGEPLRERFDPKDLSEPVRWLAQPAGRFSFKRLKPFRVEGWISDHRYRKLWTREHKRGPLIPIVPKFPEPRFTTRWVVRLDWKLLKSQGSGFLKQFLIEMFLVSKSEYGFLTTQEDHEAKNFLVVDDGRMRSTRFIGTDPEAGMPGLYWCNVLGPILTAWFGSALSDVAARRELLPNGATLLQFGDSPEICRSADILALQHQTMELLGRHRFFDMADLDRLVETPFPYVARPV